MDGDSSNLQESTVDTSGRGKDEQTISSSSDRLPRPSSSTSQPNHISLDMHNENNNYMALKRRQNTVLKISNSSLPKKCKKDQIGLDLNPPLNLVELTDDSRVGDASGIDQINPNSDNYVVLKEMFPEIDKDYLMKCCSLEADLHTIINNILEKNGNYPKENVTSNGRPICQSETVINPEPARRESGSCTNKINDRHEFLKTVFCDADPVYLEEKSKLSETDLRQFIEEAFEKKNYPKLIIKNEKTPGPSEDEFIGLYTTTFDLEQFLKLFPDPFGYFLSETRKCHYTLHGLQFLKRTLRNKSVQDIQTAYKKYNYNLARTHEALKNMPSTRTTIRSMCEIRMPETVNISFLQEACFVEHRTEIKAHLDLKVKEKKQMFDLAKERKELVECGCCYEESLFEDCATCTDGDIFCKTCIIRSADVRIGDGHNNFPCLLDCGSEFSLNLLQDLLDANVFSRLLKRKQLEEVRSADIEGLEVCPFCEFANIPPAGDNIFHCLNPECLKESCRKCHKVSHIPQRCEEVEDDDQARARKFIEDEMTKALVRECWKCKKSFIKTEGCNKMTCTCGARMCYICRAPITSYDHFNGPGGSANSRCPLYSSEKVLHEDAVKATATEALNKISAENPTLQLKYDPTKMLPKTNYRQALPNGVQEDPADLLRRLQRVHPPPNPIVYNHVPNRPNIHFRRINYLQAYRNEELYLDRFNIPEAPLNLHLPQIAPPIIHPPPYNQFYDNHYINQFQPRNRPNLQEINLPIQNCYPTIGTPTMGLNLTIVPAPQNPLQPRYERNRPEIELPQPPNPIQLAPSNRPIPVEIEPPPRRPNPLQPGNGPNFLDLEPLVGLRQPLHGVNEDLNEIWEDLDSDISDTDHSDSDHSVSDHSDTAHSDSDWDAPTSP